MSMFGLYLHNQSSVWKYRTPDNGTLVCADDSTHCLAEHPGMYSLFLVPVCDANTSILSIAQLFRRPVFNFLEDVDVQELTCIMNKWIDITPDDFIYLQTIAEQMHHFILVAVNQATNEILQLSLDTSDSYVSLCAIVHKRDTFIRTVNATHNITGAMVDTYNNDATVKQIFLNCGSNREFLSCIPNKDAVTTIDLCRVRYDTNDIVYMIDLDTNAIIPLQEDVFDLLYKKCSNCSKISMKDSFKTIRRIPTIAMLRPLNCKSVKAECNDVSTLTVTNFYDTICDNCYNELLNDGLIKKCTKCGSTFVVTQEYLKYYKQYLRSRNQPTSTANVRNINVCPVCLQLSKVTCTYCGSLIDILHDKYATVNGDILCSSCMSKGSTYSPITGYSYKPTPIFWDCKGNTSIKSYATPPQKGLLYLGVELETESDVDDVSKDARKVWGEFYGNSDTFYIKHDGSLTNGMEIVTHPMTLEYHHRVFPWIPMLKQLRYILSITSQNNSACGLHIHASKDAITTKGLINIALFFNENIDDITVFSRRGGISSYAQTIPNVVPMVQEGAPTDRILNTLSSEGRYTAVNYSLRNTLEFRVFKGTLDITALYSALEFVELLIKYCNIHTHEEVMHSSFIDLYNIAKETPETYLSFILICDELFQDIVNNSAFTNNEEADLQTNTQREDTINV